MKLSDLNSARSLVRDRQRNADAIAKAKAKLEELPAFIAAREVEINAITEKIVAIFGADVDFDFDTDDYVANIHNYTGTQSQNMGSSLSSASLGTLQRPKAAEAK